MTSAIITQDVVERALRLIEKETVFKKESITYEVQDDSNHLLIFMSIDGLPEGEPTSTLKHVGQLMNSLIPGRRGEYSWMVVFRKEGKIIESYFGGDLDNPESGL